MISRPSIPVVNVWITQSTFHKINVMPLFNRPGPWGVRFRALLHDLWCTPVWLSSGDWLGKIKWGWNNLHQLILLALNTNPDFRDQDWFRLLVMITDSITLPPNLQFNSASNRLVPCSIDGKFDFLQKFSLTKLMNIDCLEIIDTFFRVQRSSEAFYCRCRIWLNELAM